MKITIRSIFPRGVAEWLMFAAIAYAYTTFTIKILLKAETIHPAASDIGWSNVEKVFAFPAFYFGVDPLTGLIFNAVLWGWGAAKILALLLSVARRLKNARK